MHASDFEHLEPRKLFAGVPAGNVFTQTNLVSDGFIAAAHTDVDLKNPWGVAYSPTGPFWVSDNGTSKSTLYDSAGVKQSFTVAIPGGGSASSAPTGQVYNGRNAFNITKGQITAPAQFIFVGEDGAISGWNGSVDATNAVIAVDNSASGAIYKGVTIGLLKHKPILYAANFHSGAVEMYDSRFARIGKKGAFADSAIPAGYAPFNIQQLNGLLYVTYARQSADKHDDVSGKGHGYVDVFSTSGVLLNRFVHGKYLNSPWGLALAPSNFGPFGGDILVGEFGIGRIDAFNPKTGKHIGTLAKSDGSFVQNPGLWALTPGNGASGGDANAIYFTAGSNGEADGLFGRINVSA